MDDPTPQCARPALLQGLRTCFAVHRVWLGPPLTEFPTAKSALSAAIIPRKQTQPGRFLSKQKVQKFPQSSLQSKHLPHRPKPTTAMTATTGGGARLGAPGAARASRGTQPRSLRSTSLVRPFATEDSSIKRSNAAKVQKGPTFAFN